MLAKVTKRVRSRSAVQKSPTQEQVVQVHMAPELLRWSDFSTPFPSVSLGGYSRFYGTHTISDDSTESLPFYPLLSQQPEPSPSSEIPPKSFLFNTPRQSCLPMIREASLESLTSSISTESLTLRKPRNLTISTTTPPVHALKRRQRRLLRTPSIERDFGSHLHSDTSSTPGVSANTSPTDIHSSFSSFDSPERSDSNCSESPPITPSTSFEDENVSVMLSSEVLPLDKPHDESEYGSVIAAPISPISCCTVKPPAPPPPSPSQR